MVSTTLPEAKHPARRVAIISGGLGGIGVATAKRLACEGATLIIVDLPTAANHDNFEFVASTCLEFGASRVEHFYCDISDEQQVCAIFSSTMEKFGRIDVVVNNAGLMIHKPLVELTAFDWKTVLDINLLAPANFVRESFRVMKAGSAIINVSSVHAISTTELMAPYAAAKAALLSLTRSAAIEGKPLGIRVNGVLPGAIDTPMLWSNPNIASGAERVDPEYIGAPEDIAEAIAFLASPQASFITGTALTVDGGRLCSL
ncbi:SDR family NAD(P)-dependent oxidoreductase [Solimonas terrae]|uniref:SDR family oxidoreductase n=1 Tax=Solimonas terrae TaxID=1396819 RepID=A0A6M2BVB4_9GAMM|nr:SDR family oxidoreductase [Solimonas terrae]NGY05929.1 SDR family oxidoreductase [Solimonas terrae]